MFIAGDRSQAGVKAHKRAASNGDSGRCAGHHVMVARTMVSLVVANRTDHRKLVGNVGQLGKMFRELDARYLRRYGGKVAADFLRSVWLGIERFERISLTKLADIMVGGF